MSKNFPTEKEKAGMQNWVISLVTFRDIVYVQDGIDFLGNLITTPSVVAARHFTKKEAQNFIEASNTKGLLIEWDYLC